MELVDKDAVLNSYNGTVEKVQTLNKEIAVLVERRDFFEKVATKTKEFYDMLVGAEALAQEGEALIAGHESQALPKQAEAPKQVVLETTMASAHSTEKAKKDTKPHLREAMVRVMGTECLSAPMILERLVAKKWDPNASNPTQYISFHLSKEKELFTRSERRGFYTVTPNVTMPKNSSFANTSDFLTTQAGTPSEVVAKAPKVRRAPKGQKEPAKELSPKDLIDDMGIGEDTENPFGK